MSMQHQEQKWFEDFLPNNGEVDIFDKVYQVAEYLQHSHMPQLDGLGVQLLGAADSEVMIHKDGFADRDVIMLGSNSYLGIPKHPQVIKACKEACDKYGFGMGAVSLYGGITDLHRQLEEMIADFYQVEDAILFPSGYAGNVGVISSLCGKGDVIINDSANHASIFDGSVLSGADLKIYMHKNLKHLERILKRIPESKKGRLIVTDGVFSMDGDVAPLIDILGLAKKYGSRVMIDEAHAVGIIGETGRGTAEKCGCTGEVDITFGTLSKAPAAVGGYCAGNAAIVKYLRYYARTYFFSTSLPAPIVAGLIEVFKLMKDDAAGRSQLWKNIDYLKRNLNELGFNTMESDSAVIPIFVGDELKLADFHNDLRINGVFTNIVSFPAVRRKECRLRINVMSTLTREQMDRALVVLAEQGRKHGLIK